MRYHASMSSVVNLSVCDLYNQVQEGETFSLVFYMIHSQVFLHQQVQHFVLNGYGKVLRL